MTLASYRSPSGRDSGPTETDRPLSDFHLVEDADGWRLTVTVTDRLRRLLCADPEGSGATPPVFTVHVEPNLLPGDPFEVTIAARPEHG